MEQAMNANEPGNTNQQALDQEAPAKVEQFFAELGNTMLSITGEQQDLRSTLGQVIEERAEVVQIMERLVAQFAVISENQTKAADAIVSIGKVLQAMDQKIQLLMTLVDEHHKLFISHGWARPLPKVDANVN